MNSDIPVKILFLAADSSDESRLRLFQELRDIKTTLQIAKSGKYQLEQHESVRVGDITQAIFDIQPHITHCIRCGIRRSDDREFTRLVYSLLLLYFRRLITAIASSPIPFSEEDIECILMQSRCFPLLVQILCMERLFSLEDGDNSHDWRDKGLRQIKPFAHLLHTQNEG